MVSNANNMSYERYYLMDQSKGIGEVFSSLISFGIHFLGGNLSQNSTQQVKKMSFRVCIIEVEFPRRFSTDLA